MKNYCMIVGPENEGGEDSYWDLMKQSWNSKGSSFSPSVINQPMPPGTVGILNIGENDCLWMPILETTIRLEDFHFSS